MLEPLVNGLASVWARVFGSRNQRLIDEMLPKIEEVCSYEPEMMRLSDIELRAKTDQFRERIEQRRKELGVKEQFEEVARLDGVRQREEAQRVRKRAHGLEHGILDELLPEAFAAVREASKRVLGMRHFDVQLIGGMVLHCGNIAEMVTGEGKTLVSTLPAYLNALLGRGVHIITVNDYLARRDRDWMGPLHEFMGLTCGVIQSRQGSELKRQAYQCDITYGTNSEFGFDYLRDNMKVTKETQAQGKLHFAIVDEVDSILIDEARTPLIISGPAEESTEKYAIADRVAKALQGVEKNRLEQRAKQQDVDKEWLAEEEYDYVYSEKDHNIILSERGIEKAERLVGVDSFYNEANMDWPHHIDQALRAWTLYSRDKEYVVKDGEVIIVDEFTGRLQPGRNWSDGLHQAIEAKEGLRVKEENQTLATITYQNFYRLYAKLSGMTGTAMTEAAEFLQIYKLDVLNIPTNRPLVRHSHSDVVYRTSREKDKAICDEIEAVHSVGRPILVGTITIEKSESLSEMLGRRGIPHDVLNAKQHEREASIVQNAGQLGHVTIATNMAGRGTDITLGTFSREELFEHWKQRGAAPSDQGMDDPELYDKLEAHWNECGLMDEWEWREVLFQFDGADGKTHKGFRLCEGVRELGGLHIIGTERHESRRIDNQLRGRCGRQGDPGSSRFYLSLEDDLMRIFASEWVSNILERLGMEEGQEISHKMVTRSIEKAQLKVEAHHFDIRKNVLEYDQVMDEQRKLVYGNRQTVLDGGDSRGMIVRMIEDVVDSGFETYLNLELAESDHDPEGFCSWLKGRFDLRLEPNELTHDDPSETTEVVRQRVLSAFAQRETELTGDEMRKIERYLLLSKIDEKWKDHLRAMDQLRSGIGLRGYAQIDPKIAYKKEGYELFERMIAAVEEEVTQLLFRVRLVNEEEEQERLARRWGGAMEEKAQAAGMAEGAAEPPAGGGGSLATVMERTKQRQQRDERSAAAASRDTEPKRPDRRVEPKVGRNDPCTCGSGRKFKKCCGKA